MQEVALAASTAALRAPSAAASAAEFKRWYVPGRKRAVVLRLLRGESIDAVSRD
ncbi:MAG: hypothetical protein VB137_00640 [Burkholderia sp.]